MRHKLEQPLALGYCNAGVVLEIGRGVEGFAVGDPGASNGTHAEVVCVPYNLCAYISDAVGDDAAAFTVPGAITLQDSGSVACTIDLSFLSQTIRK